MEEEWSGEGWSGVERGGVERGGVEWRGKGEENVHREREGQKRLVSIRQFMEVTILTVPLPEELALQVHYNYTPHTWACRSTCGFQSES